MPHSLSSEEMRTLAREGARIRLRELRTEIAALETLMRDGGGGADRGGTQPARRRRRRRQLSAAGRAAIAAGQKARWQNAKAAKNGAELNALATGGTRPQRKRSRMSAAARKAVGERIRKYWAARRKQAAAKPARGTASKG